MAMRSNALIVSFPSFFAFIRRELSITAPRARTPSSAFGKSSSFLNFRYFPLKINTAITLTNGFCLDETRGLRLSGLSSPHPRNSAGRELFQLLLCGGSVTLGFSSRWTVSVWSDWKWRDNTEWNFSIVYNSTRS
jgi:hypothetical protein